jgi:hypothetical protein
MSQYPRGKDIMGYSIRTKRFRYTEWLSNTYRTNLPYNANYVIGREMYDYEKDPLEKESILDKTEYRKDREKMEQLFKDCIHREYKGCSQYSRLADYHEPINTTVKNGKAAKKGRGKAKSNISEE